MVYLKDYSDKIRHQIMEDESLPLFAYCYVGDSSTLAHLSVNLSGDEEVAAKGFKGQIVEPQVIDSITGKRPIKGFDFTDNVYKLIGIYLASGKTLGRFVESKFKQTSLKSKFFIAKCLPEFEQRLYEEVNKANDDDTPICTLLKRICGIDVSLDSEKSALYEFTRIASDVIDLLIIEELEKVYLSSTIISELILNKSPKELVIQMLDNFDEGAKKITQKRRKGHSLFEINNEYDVQDLLYVMLKPVFPKLKEEDPTPRVGVKSNRIDLILRDEKILIEVKMIKSTDSNETSFVEELKIDIQSYHQCQWLNHLICFVYDPLKKTKSKQNFYDLNGNQSINGTVFSIDVIVI